MDAKAIVFEAPGRPVYRSIELPDELLPQEVRFRTLCSGVSIGTERLLWEGRLDYAKFPQVLGYQSVGVVEAVGTEITDLAVGQRVLSRHSRFAGEAVAPVSGCHASAGVAERAQLTAAPDGLDVRQGSLFVLACVGYHGVDLAEVHYGDLVAVQGCGLVGLAVVAACRLRGAQILALDPSPLRRQAASAMGADQVIDPGAGGALEQVQAIAPAGAEVVFEATGFGRLLDTAFSFTRPHGKFVFQGNYGADRPIQFRYLPPHGKQLTCLFPSNDGLQPCRLAVSQLIARGALDFSPTITHIVSPDQAIGLYQELIAGDGAATDALGIVIEWDR